MNEDPTDIKIHSGEWTCEQAAALLKQYKECKTAHAQKKLLPQLESMMGRLQFVKREMSQLMEGNNEGENWKKG